MVKPTPNKIYFYKPDETLTPVTHTLVVGNLTAVTAVYGEGTLPGEKWGTITPKFKIAFTALDAYGVKKIVSISSEVAMAAALTAGQCPKVTIPFASLDQMPLSVMVLASLGGTTPFYRVAEEYIQGKFLDHNTVPTEDLVITCIKPPSASCVSEADTVKRLSKESGAVYGVKSVPFEISLGDGGVEVALKGESFEAVFNDYKVKFPAGGRGVSIKMSINPIDTAQTQFTRWLAGYEGNGDVQYFGETPQQDRVATISMYDSPHTKTYGNTHLRQVFPFVSMQTYEGATFMNKFNAKEPIEITLETKPDADAIYGALAWFKPELAA